MRAGGQDMTLLLIPSGSGPLRAVPAGAAPGPDREAVRTIARSTTLTQALVAAMDFRDLNHSLRIWVMGTAGSLQIPR